jgi:hypothetical protein
MNRSLLSLRAACIACAVLIGSSFIASGATAHPKQARPRAADVRRPTRTHRVLAGLRQRARAVFGRHGIASFQKQHGWIDRHLRAAKDQLAAAELGTSPDLQWTRRMLENPQSDWGVVGAGKLFVEKRSALTNLSYVNTHVVVLREHFDRLSSLEPSPSQRRWIAKWRDQVDILEREAARMRYQLRDTARVWEHQKEIFPSTDTWEGRVMEAVIKDDAATRDVRVEHVREYVTDWGRRKDIRLEVLE